MFGDEVRVDLDRFCGDRAVGIFAFDPEGRRIFSNRAFDHLVGYDGSEFLGRRGPFPWNLTNRLDWVLSGEPLEMGVHLTKVEFRHRSGRLIRGLLTGTAIYTERKELAAYVVFVTPTSDPPRPLRVLPAPHKVRLDSIEEELSPYVEGLNRIGQALSRLSRRECEVADRLREGLSPKEIAHALYLSEHTVRNHIKSIYSKLGFHSRAELMRFLPG